MKCTVCKIKSLAVGELDNKQLELLGQNCVDLSYKPGQQIFCEGDLTSHVIYVRNGLVKLHKRGPKKIDQILRIAKSESYLGLATIFGDRTNQYSATAIDNISACIIDTGIFKELIYSNGRFAFEIIVELSKDKLYYFNRFVNTSQKQLPGRLADALIYFSDEIHGAKEFELFFKRNELAAFLNTSRESVTRVLMKFRKDQIIELKGRNIKILSYNRLVDISKYG